MEPLSFTASIIGLIEAGKKVTRLISSTADTPQYLQTVFQEVKTLQIIFRQLETLTVDRSKQSISPREDICLRDLVATSEGCICVFKRLLDAIDRLFVQGGAFTLRNKARWAAEEENIGNILRDLQMNKSSLQCMLSIYVWFVTRVSYFKASLRRLEIEVIQFSDMM